MKTIVISSFHPYISRNILATPLLQILQDAGVRVVLAIPKYKENFFRSTFGKEHVVVVPLATGRFSRTRLGLFFKRFAELSYVSSTTIVKRKYKFYHERRIGYYLVSFLIEQVGRLEVVRALLRLLEQQLRVRGVFDAVFALNPDLVFSTDVFNENDILLLQETRARLVRTVGMVRSWDNPSKYAMRVMPDRLVLAAEELVEEMVVFHRVPRSCITVTGYPHYDKYLATPRVRREGFVRSFGLDPKKKLIFFSPVGDDLIYRNDFDQYIMELLGKRLEQILVRYPPASAVTVASTFAKPPHMVIDIPGVAFKSNSFTDREISAEDDERLALSLRFSDVVITGPTSIPLDAAFFDKPVIVADFYPSKRHSFDGIYEYEYFHFRKMEEKTGGVWHVTSEEEFMRAIDSYLADPSLHAAGREAIRAGWFSHNVDGTATTRLAQVLLGELS